MKHKMRAARSLYGPPCRRLNIGEPEPGVASYEWPAVQAAEHASRADSSVIFLWPAVQAAEH